MSAALREYLVDLLSFAAIALVVVGSLTFIVFRKELIAAWREYRAERANKE